MGDGGGTTSTTQQKTTYTPSPFDEQKAETIRQLRSLLFPAMTPQLSGGMTSQAQAGLDSINKQGVSSAAREGRSSGDETLLSLLGTKGGDKTNALNMALGMYGYGATGAPSSKTTGKTTASNAALAGAGMSLGGSMYNLGKQAYEGYKNWADAPTQNFDYGNVINPDITSTDWLINAPSETGSYGVLAPAEEAGSYGVLAPSSEGFGLGGATGAEALGGVMGGGAEYASLMEMIMANPELIMMA